VIEESNPSVVRREWQPSSLPTSNSRSRITERPSLAYGVSQLNGTEDSNSTTSKQHVSLRNRLAASVLSHSLVS
jgi:hypothetical protein